MKTIHYVNLTNGIEAIKDYKLDDYRFIRIQSTMCEQKLMGEILLSISDDFLMNLALGNKCVVYDYGAKKDVPRAIWMGLEWILYVCHKRWSIDNYKPLTKRGGRTEKFFEEQYYKLDKSTKRKIDYYKKYLMIDKLNVEIVTSSTKNDSNNDYYINIIKESK